ncbi:MAG: M28 family peptidase [Thermoleophilia bacterium]|nr:M28 family peptidase [Thermoleophilia bacterium]
MVASPPRPAANRRRRPRRGSVERPVSGRIYRAAWALVAIPLVVAAFTVGRPAPLPRPALPPSFDQAVAERLARSLAEAYPDRTPGSTGARAAAGWVEEQLTAYNLRVERQTFARTIPGLGTVTLTNLLARPLRVGPQRSAETILVLAHRDNLGLSQGLDDNASGTAALIELARNLSTLTVSHTIVFASTDGGAWGNLGAAALADRADVRGQTLAVVNLDSLGGNGSPRLEFAGDSPRSPTGVLLATAEASVLDQTGRAPALPGAVAQLLDLAFPFSLQDHAPFLAADVSAVTLTSTSGRPPPPREDTALSVEQLGVLGRAAQSLVVSLDAAAETTRGTASFVYLGGRFIRGAGIQFVLVVALVPALLATLDLFARLRRRGLLLGSALRSFRSRLLAWLWLGALGALFTAAGAFPGGASRPLAPDTAAAETWPLEALLGLGALALAGWLFTRGRLVPRGPVERADELGGHLVAMLALGGVGLAVALTNAFALILFLPSVHAWLWAPHFRDRPVLVRALLYALGLAGPAGLVASFATRYGLGFDAPWYVATLFTTGYASTALLACLLVWAAAAAQVGVVLFGRYAPYPPAAERAPRGPIRTAIRSGARAARRRRAGRPES